MPWGHQESDTTEQLSTAQMPSTLPHSGDIKDEFRDFLGSLVVKTPRSQSRGHGFNPLSGKFCMLQGIAKKKKKILADTANNVCHGSIRDSSGGPVVTLCSQCRGHRFNPWSGN